MAEAVMDLFDFHNVSPAAAPLPAAPVETIHWIVVTTTRARTGCGIICSSYDLKTKLATTESGETHSCSPDAYSDRVTCEACRRSW